MRPKKLKAPKLSDIRQTYFQDVFEALIHQGYDISLEDGQTVISFYLPEAMFAIRLNINGTWERQ